MYCVSETILSLAGVPVGWENMYSGLELISCTGQANPWSYQTLLGSDERPVLAIHLVIQATGIAQVVTCSVPSPQWSSRCSAVDTLSGLW